MDPTPTAEPFTTVEQYMSERPTPTPAEVLTPEVLTQTTATGVEVDGGDLAALIGGVVSAVLLLLVCVVAVLLWCLSRQKGSYVTNETDDDDGGDYESVGSDTALQSKEPLKEDEEE
ncbi:small cell adhesion glycoprotein-like [Stegastes partitus]|uniref:Small cell adhesion glycoprotein-like n=1 Tax=Stegastes partitus TaxID=144197 RepID=A0A9Y4MVW8_9TELE|nr:PREDICTED: small cell adhesion glycoprotein-like [Stegastes partitus]